MAEKIGWKDIGYVAIWEKDENCETGKLISKLLVQNEKTKDIGLEEVF